jgi:hypothetical protein
VSEQYKVPYLTIRSSKLNSGFIFSDPDYDIPVGLEELYKRYVKEGVPAIYRKAAQEHMEKIKQKIETPSYMEVTYKQYRLLHWEKIRSLFLHYKNKSTRVTSVSFDKKPLLTVFMWNVHKSINILRTMLNKKKWFTTTLPTDLKYFVFTLQYEPENSTTIRSYPFSNQVCVIENIAKALPIGYYLVVKEHRGNQGYRKSKDYKDIWYLPNVIMVPPEYSVNALVSKSVGVITMTSRMGWEALILNKNVIALGTTFYSLLDELKKPRSWAEMRLMINECCDSQPYDESETRKEKIVALAASYIALTHKGKYVFQGSNVLSQDNIKALSEAIIEELKMQQQSRFD